MLNAIGLVFRCENCNSIDAQGATHARVSLAPGQSKATKPSELDQRDRLEWMPVGQARASLDLHKDQVATYAGNDVDFTSSASPVAIENAIAASG